jgi:hypothetical protein
MKNFLQGVKKFICAVRKPRQAVKQLVYVVQKLLQGMK